MHLFIDTMGTLLIIYLVAQFQANWYNKNKPIFWWWHPVWVIPFIIYGAIMVWVHGVLFGTLVVFPRIIFFFPVLNLLRIPHEPFFYLHGESKNGSWWDTILERMSPTGFVLFWTGLTILYLTWFITELHKGLN